MEGKESPYQTHWLWCVKCKRRRRISECSTQTQGGRVCHTCISQETNRFCLELAELQHREGRGFVIKGSQNSRMWNSGSIKMVLEKIPTQWGNVDLCKYGLKDCGSGKPVKATVSMLHNLGEGALQPLFKQCQRKNEDHQKGCTNSGGCQNPPPFCSRFAQCLKATLLNENSPAVSLVQELLLQDLAILADIDQGELEEWKTWLSCRVCGMVSGCCLTETTTNTTATQSLKFIEVTDGKVKQLMAWTNSLSNGT